MGFLTKTAQHFVAVMVVLYTLVTVPVQAQMGNDLGPIAGKVSAIDGIGDLYAACPADVFETEKSWLTGFFSPNSKWTEDLCAANVGACATDCVSGDDAGACQSLAWVLEMTDAPKWDIEARQAYARACALGSALACTNRAAGLLNVMRPYDAWAKASDRDVVDCAKRSFIVTCNESDPWGCVMEGFVYQVRSGDPSDLVKARARYDKACRLSLEMDGDIDDRAPCRMAEQMIAQMGD